MITFNKKNTFVEVKDNDVVHLFPLSTLEVISFPDRLQLRTLASRKAVATFLLEETEYSDIQTAIDEISKLIN